MWIPPRERRFVVVYIDFGLTRNHKLKRYAFCIFVLYWVCVLRFSSYKTYNNEHTTCNKQPLHVKLNLSWYNQVRQLESYIFK